METRLTEPTNLPIEPLTLAGLEEKIENGEGNPITLELYLSLTREFLETKLSTKSGYDTYYEYERAILPTSSDPDELNLYCKRKSIRYRSLYHDFGDRLFELHRKEHIARKNNWGEINKQIGAVTHLRYNIRKRMEGWDKLRNTYYSV